MSAPLHPLPLVQNWDCHVCGECCREYVVGISDEERRRIEAQGWEKEQEFAGLPLFTRSGWPWARRYALRRQPDGSCIFLGENNRCRIHERFGPDAKPLPCKLFPFVIVPVGDRWRVSLRFACPSASANLGRPAGAHAEAIQKYVEELVVRDKLSDHSDSPQRLGLKPPVLAGSQRVSWEDFNRFADAVAGVLRESKEPLERRFRKVLALARLCRQADFDKIQGGRLKEFLSLVTASLDAETPGDPASLPPPSWIGRVLFRQALAIYSRKDQGPKRGLSKQGRLALLVAAMRFVRGKGAVPRLHGRLPDATFEQAEQSAGPLPAEANAILERYYTIKTESLQYCGPGYFHVGFWEGVEALALTYPVIMFLRRLFRDLPPAEAIQQALIIADDHFGFNRALGSMRQRFSFRILARLGELDRLIAWYSR